MDTMLGAVLCQLITAAVLIAAASVFAGHGAVVLDTIPELASAFGAALGPLAGRLLFALALSGGALVATIVVCLSAAWALGELGGRHHALAEHPRSALVLCGIRPDAAAGCCRGGHQPQPGAAVDCHRGAQCAVAAAGVVFSVPAGTQ
jgi:Mn2+/Fe2+ NRAMP family transporter